MVDEQELIARWSQKAPYKTHAENSWACKHDVESLKKQFLKRIVSLDVWFQGIHIGWAVSLTAFKLESW